MKIIICGLLALCSAAFAGSDEVLTQLRAEADLAYESLDLLPAHEHGWFSPENSRHLAHFIAEKDPTIVIEVGSWLGMSTLFMAEKLSPGAQLYAIDHFKGDAAINATQAYRDKLPTLYEQFLSNVVQKNMDSVIVPIKSTTVEAFERLNGHIKADLIYVDAAHDTESVYRDIVMYAQLLADDGIMTGDDWGWPTVRAAVERYAEENGKRIGCEGNFWYYY